VRDRASSTPPLIIITVIITNNSTNTSRTSRGTSTDLLPRLGIETESIPLVVLMVIDLAMGVGFTAITLSSLVLSWLSITYGFTVQAVQSSEGRLSSKVGDGPGHLCLETHP
jgi:hypothetical protein